MKISWNFQSWAEFMDVPVKNFFFRDGYPDWHLLLQQ